MIKEMKRFEKKKKIEDARIIFIGIIFNHFLDSKM